MAALTVSPRSSDDGSVRATCVSWERRALASVRRDTRSANDACSSAASTKIRRAYPARAPVAAKTSTTCADVSVGTGADDTASSGSVAPPAARKPPW